MLPLRNGRWELQGAGDAEIDEVMTWFQDVASVKIWGGPFFRYPFTRHTFREDCRLNEVDSYALRNDTGALAAFGQSYERDGRGHLARIVSNPTLRRTGAGRQLVRMIIASLSAQHDYDEFSLFVYRHNRPAYDCYLSLGFVVEDYPAGAPMPDECYFLTWKNRER